MLSKTNKKSLINDVVKNTCLMLVVHVLTQTRAGKKLFDEDSLYAILFWALGFVFYHIVLVQVLPPL